MTLSVSGDQLVHGFLDLCCHIACVVPVAIQLYQVLLGARNKFMLLFDIHSDYILHTSVLCTFAFLPKDRKQR